MFGCVQDGRKEDMREEGLCVEVYKQNMIELKKTGKDKEGFVGKL